MILEHFALLIQVQSLDKKIGSHLKNISIQEERVISLQKARSLREKQLAEDQETKEKLKAELGQKEKELFEKDQLIARSLERQKTASTEAQCKAIENEFAQFMPQKEKLEIEVYALLEKQEALEQTIKDHEIFLAGSLKTLSEIQKEVDLHTQKDKEEIQILEERIKIDLDSAPPSIKNIWNDLSKKFRFNSPLSFVENGVCLECRYSVGRNTENQIEKGGVIEFCPNCKRLLAPKKRV